MTEHAYLIVLLPLFSFLTIVFALRWKEMVSAVFSVAMISTSLLMSIIGSALYYGWGLALYKYCGTSISLIIGITLLILQIKSSTFWIIRYGQGPLEKLWRKLTWMNFVKEPASILKTAR